MCRRVSEVSAGKLAVVKSNIEFEESLHDDQWNVESNTSIQYCLERCQKCHGIPLEMMANKIEFVNNFVLTDCYG